MKTANLGLPGSVTVIGMVYVIALAFAPMPGAAAPADQTSLGGSTRAFGPDTTGAICPHTLYEKHAMTRLIEAHRTLIMVPTGMPSVPAWNTGRLTVF